MSGVGGVFPNYEDHLLDKKKISEYFTGNFHEVLYPLNYSSKYGPWQYHCPPDHKNFIDLNTLTWNGKIKVTNKTNPSTTSDLSIYKRCFHRDSNSGPPVY